MFGVDAIKIERLFLLKNIIMYKEWNILIGLFKATVEQTNMLTGVPKQQTKVIFKRWINEGEKLLKIIENESNNEFLEEVTEVIENSIHELRTNKLI